MHHYFFVRSRANSVTAANVGTKVKSGCALPFGQEELMWDVENSGAKTDETIKYSFECKVDALSHPCTQYTQVGVLCERYFIGAFWSYSICRAAKSVQLV